VSIHRVHSCCFLHFLLFFHLTLCLSNECHFRRNALFEISDIRGNYPQFFFENEDGSITFYGKWEKVQDLNETRDLPEEILQQFPDMETWDRVFGNLVESFSF
jgi:hypothetical protein